MAGSLKLFGGMYENMPRLPQRAVGFCTDTNELYVGGESGNILMASNDSAMGNFHRIKLTGQGDFEENGSLFIKDGRLCLTLDGAARALPFKAEGVPKVSEQADTVQLAQALNGLIDALIHSGAMEEI